MTVAHHSRMVRPAPSTRTHPLRPARTHQGHGCRVVNSEYADCLAPAAGSIRRSPAGSRARPGRRPRCSQPALQRSTDGEAALLPVCGPRTAAAPPQVCPCLRLPDHLHKASAAASILIHSTGVLVNITCTNGFVCKKTSCERACAVGRLGQRFGKRDQLLDASTVRLDLQPSMRQG